MKKAVLIITFLVVFMLSIPVTAGENRPIDGDEINLPSVPNSCCFPFYGETCEDKLGVLEYPANVPFHLKDGWVRMFTGKPYTYNESFTYEDMAIDRAGFNRNTSGVELTIDFHPYDGIDNFEVILPIPHIFVGDFLGGNAKFKTYLYEFNQGMTGTAEFRMRWFLDAAGFNPPDWTIENDLFGTSVDVQECRVLIEFYEEYQRLAYRFQRTCLSFRIFLQIFSHKRINTGR